MKFLLSTIASLSIGGVGAAHLATNVNQQNNQISSTFKETRVPLGQVVKLSTDQNERIWQLDFTFDLAPGENIRSIRFEGGGLHSYVGWGGDHWERQWSEISVNPSSVLNVIFDEEHWDGLASQEDHLKFTLLTGIKGTNQCELTFYFFTKSYNSFNGSWGTLAIGDALVFSTY